MLCLLLSNSYVPLKFISERRTFRLLFNNKVEVISNWDLKIKTSSVVFPLPSIIRLNNNYNKMFSSKSYDRSSIIKRDDKRCQYCGEKLALNKITIDHIIPISKGGKSSFDNCVVSCRPCNDYK